MINRTILLFTLMALTIWGTGQNTESLNQQHGAGIRTRILDRGVDGISITYRAGTLLTNQQTANGTHWQRLAMPGYTLTRDVGKPQVPTFAEMVMVPEGASFRYLVAYGDDTLLHGYNVFPALPPATDRYGDPEPLFGIDSVTYATNAFWPEYPVRIADIQELRGVRVIWFDILPVQVNPVTGAVQITRDITLEVEFPGAEKFMDYSLHSEEFLRNYPMLAANAPLIANEIRQELSQRSLQTPPPPAPTANYIILTDSIFMAAATRLANWKMQLGYAVEIVAANNWTYPAMQQAVHSRYHAWIPKPDYLVILGDHDRLPAQMVLNPDNELYGTDLHLVTMGIQIFDHLPDMAKGRISVANATQAMQVVDKIINYEKNPPTDSSFYQTGLNCAQFQDDDFDNYADRRFVHTSEEVLEYLTGKGYTINRVYYADTANSIPLNYNLNYYSNGQSLPPALLSPSFNWNGGPSHITQRINAGAFYVLHRDHGYAGGSGWHAPNYVTGHLNSLSNGAKTPVVFSINCHTGEFTLTECFAERFLRHNNGGAVGVVAASYYSYSGWNDGFTAGMFDAIWSSPGLVPAFGSGGIFAPILSPHGDIRNMGFVVNQGLLRMTQTWSTALIAAKYTYRLFHYFGDPSMRIRTTIPVQTVAQHADSLPCSATTFQLQGVTPAATTATLTIPGKIIGKTTLVNGQGTIPVAPFAATWLLLTVSGPELIPYTDTIHIITTPLSVVPFVEPVRCQGKAEGEIHLQISCGIQPFQVTWAHGPTSPTLTNLPAGTYHYTITDAGLTSITDSVIITEPAIPLVISGTITDVLCYYGNNGSVSISVSGGVPPYAVKWGSGNQNTVITGLSAGKHAVTVTDQVGCQVKDTFIIAQPLPLQVSDQLQHDATGNCTGAATALPSGGTPPYTYQWNDPQNQTQATATNLCPGKFRVYVTDHNGCITIRDVTIYNVSGIPEPGGAAMELYPNPLTGDMLIINLPPAFTNTPDLLIQLFDLSGREVFRQNLTPEDQKIKVSPFPKPEGVYTLILRHPDGQMIVGKVMRIRGVEN